MTDYSSTPSLDEEGHDEFPSCLSLDRYYWLIALLASSRAEQPMTLSYPINVWAPYPARESNPQTPELKSSGSPMA